MQFDKELVPINLCAKEALSVSHTTIVILQKKYQPNFTACFFYPFITRP